MKTEEQLFTEIAGGEITCPCWDRCIAKPPPKPVYNPRVIGVGEVFMGYDSKHEDYRQFVDCLAHYVCEYVRQRIRELRDSAEHKLRSIMEAWRILDEQNCDWTVFRDCIESFKMNLCSQQTELDTILNAKLFNICFDVIDRLKRVSA